MSYLRLKAPHVACTAFHILTGRQHGIICLPRHMINRTLYYSCSAANVNHLKVPEELDNKRWSCCQTSCPPAGMVPGWIFGSAMSCMLRKGLNAASNSGPACTCAADVNLLKVPDDLDDKKVVLLSDIMPTGWHGAHLANVEKGSRVAIWGCGPGKCLVLQQP